jgi:hypothetical protein
MDGYAQNTVRSHSTLSFVLFNLGTVENLTCLLLSGMRRRSK